MIRRLYSSQAKPSVSSFFKESASYKDMREAIEEDRREHPDLEAYKLTDADKQQLTKVNAMTADEGLNRDYEVLLKSIREVRRLTIDWTNIRDDDMDAVKRVAKRVGYTLDDPNTNFQS